MPSPKSNRSDHARQAAAQSSPAAAKEIGESFLTVHRNYMNSLQETHARAQEHYRQAQADYMRAMYDAQLKSQKIQEDAYRACASSMQGACGQEDMPRLMREAQERYGKDLEAGRSMVRQSVEEANRSASNALQQANDEANKAGDQARLAYIKGVQDRLGSVDPRAVGSDVIALIGQSLLAASYCAGPAQRA